MRISTYSGISFIQFSNAIFQLLGLLMNYKYPPKHFAFIDKCLGVFLMSQVPLKMVSGLNINIAVRPESWSAR